MTKGKRYRGGACILAVLLAIMALLASCATSDAGTGKTGEAIVEPTAIDDDRDSGMDPAGPALPVPSASSLSDEEWERLLEEHARSSEEQMQEPVPVQAPEEETSVNILPIGPEPEPVAEPMPAVEPEPGPPVTDIPEQEPAPRPAKEPEEAENPDPVRIVDGEKAEAIEDGRIIYHGDNSVEIPFGPEEGDSAWADVSVGGEPGKVIRTDEELPSMPDWLMSPAEKEERDEVSIVSVYVPEEQKETDDGIRPDDIFEIGERYRAGRAAALEEAKGERVSRVIMASLPFIIIAMGAALVAALVMILMRKIKTAREERHEELEGIEVVSDCMMVARPGRGVDPQEKEAQADEPPERLMSEDDARRMVEEAFDEAFPQDEDDIGE